MLEKGVCYVYNDHGYYYITIHLVYYFSLQIGLPASGLASPPCFSDNLSNCCLYPDPHHDDLYLNASSFLALINGERDHPNATGKTPGSYPGPIFCFSDPLCSPLQPGLTPVTDSGSLLPTLQLGGRTFFVWAAWC